MAQIGGPLPCAKHDVPVYRIYTVGMGNAPSRRKTQEHRARGGRVEISLLQNSLGDMAAAGGTASSTTHNRLYRSLSSSGFVLLTEQQQRPPVQVAGGFAFVCLARYKPAGFHGLALRFLQAVIAQP